MDTQKRAIIDKVLSEAAEHYRVETADSVKKEDLLVFFKLAYSEQFNAEDYHNQEGVARRWEWRNLKNPDISSRQFPSWVCRDSKTNAIVGHFGTMPVSLKYKGASYPAAWGIDLIATPRYRKSGIASFLVSSVLKNTKNNLSLFLLAGLNDYVVEKVFKKVGFIHLGHIPAYIRINKLDNILQSKIRIGILARLMGIFGDILLNLLYVPSYLRGLKYRNRETTIAEVESFDTSFDRLWEKTSGSFPVVIKRDSKHLNWRFVTQPYWKYKIFKAERNGELKGYIVLREGKSRGLRVGVVSDIFCVPDDIRTIDSLIIFVIKTFKKKRDIDLIRCDMLHRNFERILRKFGFIRMRSSSHFMVTNIHRDMDPNFVANRDNWFVNYADCDLDLSGRR